jgi:hypothetical protein
MGQEDGNGDRRVIVMLQQIVAIILQNVMNRDCIFTIDYTSIISKISFIFSYIRPVGCHVALIYSATIGQSSATSATSAKLRQTILSIQYVFCESCFANSFKYLFAL